MFLDNTKSDIRLRHPASHSPRHLVTNPALAPLLIVAASLCFAILSACIRQLSAELDSFVVAFWRNLFGLVFMLPWLWRHGLGSLRTGRFGWFTLRSVISLISMLCGFTSLAMLPFADAISFSFTAPLFATILAATVLKEDVRMRRWTATTVGFIGVLIIMRPGASTFSLGEVLAIAGAFLSAVVSMIVKDLSRTEGSQAIVTYMVLLLTPMSLVTALPYWSWPDLAGWPFIVGMGFFGTLGHLCWVRGFALADASAVMPYDYVRLVFAVIIGYVAFAETPDSYTLVGSAVIVAAGLYIAHREATLSRATHGQATVALATASLATDISADPAAVSKPADQDPLP
jgi:drug/metabolite transporter (DMT)-like permease